jgi:hypothetical protein
MSGFKQTGRNKFSQDLSINRRNVEVLDGTENAKKLPGISAKNKAHPLRGKRSERQVTRSSKVLPGVKPEKR